MGRKLAKIDWKRVDQMLLAQCSGAEIATALGITDDCLYRRCMRDHGVSFAEYARQKRALGVSTAKEIFYKKAFIDGDTTAAIFWLKNNVGWTDKRAVQSTHTAEIKIFIPENDRDKAESGQTDTISGK